MKMSDIMTRTVPAEPWAEGGKIPWNEPRFSERMLREHLSQLHDAASRRFCIIDQHVDWIHRQLLSEKPSRILELGCGPGFYLQRLAQLGHTCAGIDFSPASIAYAREKADEQNLIIHYQQEDIRKADFGQDLDLVMLIFGELNVFKPEDAKFILAKASEALKVGGILLLEIQTFDPVRAGGMRQSSWQSLLSGLFSNKPHLWLQEHFWSEQSNTATTRHFIIDAATAEVTLFAESNQGYLEDQYRHMLEETGFGDIRFCSSLTGDNGNHQDGMAVVVAYRR